MRSLDEGEFRDKLYRARFSLGLDYPHVIEMRFVERSFERLLADAREGAVATGNREALLRLHEELQQLQETLNNDSRYAVPSDEPLMLDALAEAVEGDTRNAGVPAGDGNGGSPFSGIPH